MFFRGPESTLGLFRKKPKKTKYPKTLFVHTNSQLLLFLYGLKGLKGQCGSKLIVPKVSRVRRYFLYGLKGLKGQCGSKLIVPKVPEVRRDYYSEV